MFCACRDGVVTFLEENARLLAAVGIGIAVMQLVLLVFSCALIAAKMRGVNDVVDDGHLDDNLYLDKEVIKQLKKLSEVKDVAIARLKKEREKSEEKRKKSEARLKKKAKTEKKEAKKKKEKGGAGDDTAVATTGAKVVV